MGPPLSCRWRSWSLLEQMPDKCPILPRVHMVIRPKPFDETVRPSHYDMQIAVLATMKHIAEGQVLILQLFYL